MTGPEGAQPKSLEAARDWTDDFIRRAGTGHVLAWSAPYRTTDDEGDDTRAQRGECSCGGWVKIEWNGRSRWSPEIDRPCAKRPPAEVNRNEVLPR